VEGDRQFQDQASLMFAGGQKMNLDGGKKVRMKQMSNVCTVRVCSVNSTTVQKCLNWAHYVCANCRKRSLHVTGARNGRQFTYCGC
jgi:hypothetical protein